MGDILVFLLLLILRVYWFDLRVFTCEISCLRFFVFLVWLAKRDFANGRIKVNVEGGEEEEEDESRVHANHCDSSMRLHLTRLDLT